MGLVSVILSVLAAVIACRARREAAELRRTLEQARRRPQAEPREWMSRPVPGRNLP